MLQRKVAVVRVGEAVAALLIKSNTVQITEWEDGTLYIEAVTGENIILDPDEKSDGHRPTPLTSTT